MTDHQPTADQTARPRALAFISESAAELRRVQWPDRTAIIAMSAVVLAFIVALGAYIGLADLAARTVIDALL